MAASQVFSPPFKHNIYRDANEIPYTHISNLGSGGGGTVDKVSIPDSTGALTIYACKQIKLPPTSRSLESKRRWEAKIKEIRNEAIIISKLRNKHIIELVATYETAFDNLPKFCIVMKPVADQDLGRYLQRVDGMGPEEKSEAILEMRYWAGCLTRAMDYIHEKRVKHKDIKPANILVRGNLILITDFGIAKEFLGDESQTSDGAGTMLYKPPEALGEVQKRGRASDIFSLGCCFLEMATAMITSGGLYTLKALRDGGTFGQRPDAILRWIHYLFSILAAKGRERRRLAKPGYEGPKDLVLVLEHAATLPALAFFMMDPNPHKRATARQLKSLIGTWDRDFFCSSCRRGIGREVDPNLDLHSKFKVEGLNFPEDPEVALQEPVAKDWKPPNIDDPEMDGQIACETRWEAAKRLWLTEHMWW